MFIRYSDAAISVSQTLKDFYANNYGKQVSYIPNGINITECNDLDLLDKFGLKRKEYILYVGRLIPTKGSATLLDAYKRLKTDLKLVIVGDSCYTDSFVIELKKKAEGTNTVFLGYQYGEALNQLYANCRLFIFPSQIEGLPIVLLEALSFGIPVIFSDIPEDMEIAKEVAIPFKNADPDDLYGKMKEFLANPDSGERLAEKAKRHIAENYNWDKITEQTEAVYYSILK
ncbi:MAG: glycosyltransferase family 4 protein [Nitrospirae bacterium]|nr:glycosyltransferase family 4 protein [Nitrospirota bacterium]